MLLKILPGGRSNMRISRERVPMLSLRVTAVAAAIEAIVQVNEPYVERPRARSGCLILTDRMLSVTRTVFNMMIYIMDTYIGLHARTVYVRACSCTYECSGSSSNLNPEKVGTAGA